MGNPGVNITGLNFDPTPGNNLVRFGAVQVVVSTASTTNLTVTVPAGATYGPITETVNGLVAYSSAVFEPTFPGNGLSIGPSTFAARVDIPTPNQPISCAVGDLNGDGKVDVVTANSADNTISIFQNQSTPGNIAFAPRVNLATGNSPQGVAIGDLDGDGQPDLAVANANAFYRLRFTDP